MTPAGGRNDLVAPNDGFQGMDAGWDPVWDAATRVDSLGWVAEMRIPFSQLRFREGERQVWGVNFRRDILHAGEGGGLGVEAVNRKRPGFVLRTPVGAGGRAPARVDWKSFRTLSRARPTTSALVAGNPFDDGSVYGGSAGLDLKYGLTGGLTLDATVNPRLRSEWRRDPAVVNLTAFETFFEERRPFFVEGAGLFGFGGLEGLRFFYSRRVGQRPARSIVPGGFVDQPTQSTILGAAKISGRTDSGWVVAFMNATTQRENARISPGVGAPVFEVPVHPLSNIAALRLRRDIREGDQYIG